VIARWKGVIEEIHFGGQIMPLAMIENLYLKKPSFGPSKWPQKLKPAKNSKLPKLPESRFEPFGKGGWPLISTLINHFKVVVPQSSLIVDLIQVSSRPLDHNLVEGQDKLKGLRIEYLNTRQPSDQT
jgi:hypothetical protein